MNFVHLLPLCKISNLLFHREKDIKIKQKQQFNLGDRQKFVNLEKNIPHCKFCRNCKYKK